MIIQRVLTDEEQQVLFVREAAEIDARIARQVRRAILGSGKTRHEDKYTMFRRLWGG